MAWKIHDSFFFSIKVSQYHSLRGFETGRADSSTSDSRFVFGNRFSEGAEDSKAGVAPGMAVGMVEVWISRQMRHGRLLRPGPAAVLRPRHGRAPRRRPWGGAGGVQRLEFSLKFMRSLFQWMLHGKNYELSRKWPWQMCKYDMVNPLNTGLVTYRSFTKRWTSL